jgi:probable RNA-binding protein EIF1AD
MGRPKRNVFAAAEETSTPPSSLTTTQAIARVIKAEGNSLYSCLLSDQKTVLVELPSRFRNTIWIKRGGYVLIDTKEGDVRQNKIDGEIINVVRDEHLWRKETYWCAQSLCIEVEMLFADPASGPRNLPKPLPTPEIPTRKNRQLARCPRQIRKKMNRLDI